MSDFQCSADIGNLLFNRFYLELENKIICEIVSVQFVQGSISTDNSILDLELQ